MPEQADDLFMETGAGLEQPEGLPAGDGAGKKGFLLSAEPGKHHRIDSIGRLQKGGRFDEHPEAVTLLQGLDGVENRQKIPAVAGPPLNPPLLGHAHQDLHELDAADSVAGHQLRLRDMTVELALDSIFGYAIIIFLFGGNRYGDIQIPDFRGGEGEKETPVGAKHDVSFPLQDRERLAHGRSGDIKLVRQRLFHQVSPLRHGLITHVLDDPDGELRYEGFDRCSLSFFHNMFI